MDSVSVQGKWQEIKGKIQKAWGKLTEDELEQAKGDYKAIEGLIQQKYGRAREWYEKELREILGAADAEKDVAVENIKKSLKDNS